MTDQQQSEPQIITLTRPQDRHVLVMSADGELLGLDPAGDLDLFSDAGDNVIWDRTSDGLTHSATGTVLVADVAGDTCTVQLGSDTAELLIAHGPEKLPSEYLEHLRREGWVCLNTILPPDVVDGLERVACTGPYEHLEQSQDSPKICQHPSVGRSVSEPVSLWVIREYLQERDIHVGHPPGFNVLPPETIATAGRGWHADIPYTRSASPQPPFPRNGSPKACNRNTFVSDFSYRNGATLR